MSVNVLQLIIETDNEVLVKSIRNLALIHSTASNSNIIESYWKLITEDARDVPDAIKIYFLCTLSLEKGLQDVLERTTKVPYSRIAKLLTDACENYLNGTLKEKEFLDVVKKIKY
jgi:hypothetical protein